MLNLVARAESHLSKRGDTPLNIIYMDLQNDLI